MSYAAVINGTNGWIKADKLFDRIPVLSTVGNLVNLFQKCVVIPRMDKVEIDKSEYYRYLNEKSIVRCTLLLLPVLGNVIVAIYDMAVSLLKVQKNQAAISPKVIVKEINDDIALARMMQHGHFFQGPTEILHKGLVMGMPTDPIMTNLIPTRVNIDLQSPKFSFNESDISKKNLPELSTWFKEILINKGDLSQNSAEKAAKFLMDKIVSFFDKNKSVKTFMTENSILERTDQFGKTFADQSLYYDEGIFFNMTGALSIEGFRPFPNLFLKAEREFEITLKFNCNFLEVDMQQAKDMANDPSVQNWINNRTGDDLFDGTNSGKNTSFPAKYLVHKTQNPPIAIVQAIN